MCLICIDFQKDALTTTEAWRNLQEMRETMTDEHYDEVVALIVDKIYNEADTEGDEGELVNYLEKLEEDGQISFGWDEPEGLAFEEDDLNHPWYIPPFED
jgi:hypothetical protein